MAPELTWGKQVSIAVGTAIFWLFQRPLNPSSGSGFYFLRTPKCPCSFSHWLLDRWLSTVFLSLLISKCNSIQQCGYPGVHRPRAPGVLAGVMAQGHAYSWFMSGSMWASGWYFLPGRSSKGNATKAMTSVSRLSSRV